MKQISIVFILFFVFLNCAKAQIRRNNSNTNTPVLNEKFWQPEKIIVGGNISNLGFWGNVSSFGFNLLSGYKVTKNFWPGLSFNYFTYSEKGFLANLPAKYGLTGVGSGIFARYKIANFFMPSVELERNWIIAKSPYYDPGSQTIKRVRTSYGATSLLVGGGLYRGADNAGQYILVLYDVLGNYENTSPFQNNVAIKIGIMVSDVFKTRTKKR